jgi:hypothetical protein
VGHQEGDGTIATDADRPGQIAWERRAINLERHLILSPNGCRSMKFPILEISLDFGLKQGFITSFL